MKKRWIVEGRCRGSKVIRRGLQEWQVWGVGGTKSEARAMVQALSARFNGSVRPSDPVWEFRVR